MALKFNNNNITSVKYNGINLKTVKYNGTLVFQSPVSNPTIGAITTIYNSASFSVTNTSLYSVNLKVIVNGYTQTKAAGAVGTGLETQSFTFNNGDHGISSGLTYSIIAYAEFGSFISTNANSSFTTTTVYTTMPSFVGAPTSTWNSISWKLKNDDDATSTVKTRLYANDQNTPIGDELTVSLAPGGEYTFSKTGLSYSTNYYIKRTAQANDGKLQPNYTTTGAYATAAQPVTPPPNVSIISKTSYSVTIRVINGSPDDSATLFYSVVSNNGSPTGYTQHGTTLQGYNTDSNGIDITLSTLYIGGSFSPNTNYDVYIKAQISGWKESSSIKHDIQTNPILTAPVITITDVVYNGFKWYSQNQSTVATVQIYSNVNNNTTWPSAYQDTSVAPSANTSTFPSTGRYTAAAGTSYTVYARAVDLNGEYESSGIGSATVPVASQPTLTNTSKTSTSLTFSIKNNDGSAGSYYWYLSDGSQSSGAISIGAEATLEFTVPGLSASTSYQTVVYVIVPNKISSSSHSVTTSTNATPVAATPTNTNITTTSNSISWQVRNNDASTATIYSKIDGYGDQTKTVSGNTTSDTFTQSGLSSNTTYYIRSWAAVTGKTTSDINGEVDPATTGANLPVIEGLSAASPSNNKVQIWYVTNPYWVEWQYSTDWVSWSSVTNNCPLSSNGNKQAGAVSYTVPAGSPLIIRARAHIGSCSGTAGNWYYYEVWVAGIYG